MPRDVDLKEQTSDVLNELRTTSCTLPNTRDTVNKHIHAAG